MLARASLGSVGRRTFSFRSLPIPKTLSSLSSTSSHKDSAVSVVSYRDGQRKQDELGATAATNGPVTPPGSDSQKIAQPLNPSIYSQLTPTLSKFTLRDKVAVITG